MVCLPDVLYVLGCRQAHLNAFRGIAQPRWYYSEGKRLRLSVLSFSDKLATIEAFWILISFFCFFNREL